MIRSRVDALVGDAFGVDRSCRDKAVIERGMSAIRQLRGVLDNQELVCAEALSGISPFVQVDLAEGFQTSARDAGRVLKRMRVAYQAPAMGEALADGAVQAGHLDKLDAAVGRLDPAARRALLAEAPTLADVAAGSTVEDFDRYLRQREQALSSDGGEALFRRQRGMVRLKDYAGDSGMRIFQLTVDPFTGVKLDQQIGASVEALFHAGHLPDHAPLDPLQRHSFLRAHALLNLLDGKGARAGAPEMIVVVDTRVPDGAQPVIDWGTPNVSIPASIAEHLAARSKVVTVTVDGGRVLNAPGDHNVGRSQRVATAGQRRMLRALYATCAIPGCTTRFNKCTIHHIQYWRNNGYTDLINLLPLCGQHHHAVHDLGWLLALDTDRNLTITLPDGTTMHGVPNRAGLTQQLAAASLACVAGSGVGGGWSSTDDLRLEATIRATLDTIMARQSRHTGNGDPSVPEPDSGDARSPP